MKAIQYKPTSSRKAAAVMLKSGAVKIEKEKPVVGTILGRPAGSTNEWNIACALWKAGWTFEYQVPIRSGRRIRGGQVLDFLVNTVPIRTVLRVQGDYWHRNSALEELKADDIARHLGEPVRIVDAAGKDSDTFDAAYHFVIIQFGRA